MVVICHFMANVSHAAQFLHGFFSFFALRTFLMVGDRLGHLRSFRKRCVVPLSGCGQACCNRKRNSVLEVLSVI